MSDKSITEQKTSLIKAKKDGLEAVINYYFQHKTPSQFIKTRPGPNGMVFRYVPIGYVVSQLNIAFNFCWSWRILEQQIGKDQIWLRGELTITDPKTNFSVTRSGVGGAIIKKSTKTNTPLSIANDLKASDSDALKVAAAKFGIGSDVKFKEMDILEDMPDEVDEDTSESERQIVSNRYFAVAADRGFAGEKAKDHLKNYYKVAHWADLTKGQIEIGIALMEKEYQVVSEGQEPLRTGATRKSDPVAVAEEIFADGEVIENPEDVDVDSIKLPEEESQV